jgi:hypothetical protein
MQRETPNQSMKPTPKEFASRLAPHTQGLTHHSSQLRLATDNGKMISHENNNRTSLGVSHRVSLHHDSDIKILLDRTYPNVGCFCPYSHRRHFSCRRLDQQRAIRWPNKSLAWHFLYRIRSDRYELGAHHCRYCFHTNWLINLTDSCR